MNEDKKNRGIALLVTLLIHVLLGLLLWLIHLERAVPLEEDGILVMVGEMEESMGSDAMETVGEQDIEGAVEESAVDATSAPMEASTPDPAPVPDEPLIAQNEDPAPAIAAEKRKKEEEARKAEERRKAEEKAKADAEAKRKAAEAEAKAKADAEAAQKKAEAEAKRKAEEEARKAEQARKEAEAAAINNRLANAFGGNSGSASTAQGAQGSPTGNSTSGATSGKTTGTGTQGTHSGGGVNVSGLDGRGVKGGLARPSFNVNASGKVVVAITVDPSGKVTSATVRPSGTTTSNATLRNAAMEAAKKTAFEPMAGVTSQGTITYNFDSNN